MQAIILAAGMGNRLGKYTKDNTKCMLEINGKTLIERALDALNEAGICKCILVVGYKKENLINFIGKKYRNIDIEYVSNDIYDKTNNIYSLYLVKDHLVREDTILLESDLIFENRVISEIIACPGPTAAAVAKWEPWMDGTVTTLTDDKTISAFIPKSSFDYGNRNSYYKTVNIYKFSREFSKNHYVPFLEAYLCSMGKNEYYEQVLRVVASLENSEIKAFVFEGHKWYEIDDIQDKDIAETIFADNKNRLSLINRRYGGYWRFPDLLDFCYLVNPFFPPKTMLDEFISNFNILIAEYPSGLGIQNLLSAKLFNIDNSQILTGNGAAELVRVISGVLNGKIGLIYPTFNEYEECIIQNQKCSIVYFEPDNFLYGKDDLIEFSGFCDVMVLINPDNPSGNYIPRKDLLELVSLLKDRGKQLVLDESFADFAEEKDPSFLKQEIMDQYPNLIIIKSLSKSYGIPGLRLGVLASGNKKIIEEARKKIPIWNINSIGEFFLQIIGKYRKEYQNSCCLIARERKWLKEELEKTGVFYVYPSEANYFLCRITSGMTARNLTECLLDRYNIYIKDLTGKKGIPDNNLFRIAVRGRNDNKKLVDALGSIKLFPKP